MKKIIAYGMPFMDFLVNIDHLPTGKNDGARIRKTSWQGGGKVSTALAAVGQLGGISSMIGVIGADSYGSFLIEDFKYYNVDTSHLIRDGSNGFSVVLSDPVTQGRNILARSPKCRPYTVDDIDEEFVASHDILHLENANDVSRRLADIMHEHGGIVSIDADTYNEGIQNMLDRIDVFIGSEFYYNSLFGEDSSLQPIHFKENMKKVTEWGPSIVVFTFGERGSAVYTKEGEFAYLPGFEVETVDTVGAGDVYHGAYVYALAADYDPVRAAEFANAVAAIKCTGIGGRAGIPDLSMTESFLKTGKYDDTLLKEKDKRYESFNL